MIADGFDLYGGDAVQKLTYLTFRAVENRTAFVTTDTSHLSAIVDANGRQLAVDTDFEGSPLVLVADLPMGSGATIYSSIGDVLGWVALAGFAFFFTFMIVVRIRARKVAKK
ncbi:MAG: hypothetical protein HGA79_03125 [Anaerolineales bacterium]|nr:hypothetical protein [Anaerolineales bacterium]